MNSQQPADSQTIFEDCLLTTAEIVQRKLLNILSCPITNGPIYVVPIEVTKEAIRHGIIYSHTLNKAVGMIRNFQIDFVRVEKAPTGALAKVLYKEAKPKFAKTELKEGKLPFSDSNFQYKGDWIELSEEPYKLCTSIGSQCAFKAKGDITLEFGAHPWSGIADIFVNNILVNTVDLYEPHTTIPRLVNLELGESLCNIYILCNGARNTLSAGHQILFSGYLFLTDEFEELRYKRTIRMRGAEFSPLFHEYLDAVPEDGLALDIGAGNRQIDDARYVALDYAAYQEPDIIGDAMRLPFRDESIDFIYSSGVFEHLPDPLLAGREVHRVLKKGGRLLLNWAFMQPVHSEGQHFFNATKWGVEETFKQLEIHSMTYDTSFSFLFNWIISVSEVSQYINRNEKKIIDAFFKRIDAKIPYERRLYAANGVWIDATKAA